MAHLPSPSHAYMRWRALSPPVRRCPPWPVIQTIPVSAVSSVAGAGWVRAGNDITSRRSSIARRGTARLTPRDAIGMIQSAGRRRRRRWLFHLFGSSRSGCCADAPPWDTERPNGPRRAPTGRSVGRNSWARLESVVSCKVRLTVVMC